MKKYNTKKQPNLDKLPKFTIMPCEVIADKNISANEKILLSLIVVLSNANGYAWASNEYLADALGVNKNTISRSINNLVKAEYIETDIKLDYKRKIYLSTKMFRPLNKIDEAPKQNCVYNNKKEYNKGIKQENFSDNINKVDISTESEAINDYDFSKYSHSCSSEMDLQSSAKRFAKIVEENEKHKAGLA